MLAYEIVLELEDWDASRERDKLIQSYRGNFHDEVWRRIVSMETRTQKRCLVIVPPTLGYDEAATMRRAAQTALDYIIGKGARMEEWKPVICSIARINLPVFLDPELKPSHKLKDNTEVDIRILKDKKENEDV